MISLYLRYLPGLLSYSFIIRSILATTESVENFIHLQGSLPRSTIEWIVSINDRQKVSVPVWGHFLKRKSRFRALNESLIKDRYLRVCIFFWWTDLSPFLCENKWQIIIEVFRVYLESTDAFSRISFNSLKIEFISVIHINISLCIY